MKRVTLLAISFLVNRSNMSYAVFSAFPPLSLGACLSSGSTHSQMSLQSIRDIKSSMSERKWGPGICNIVSFIKQGSETNLANC